MSEFEHYLNIQPSAERHVPKSLYQVRRIADNFRMDVNPVVLTNAEFYLSRVHHSINTSFLKAFFVPEKNVSHSESQEHARLVA